MVGAIFYTEDLAHLQGDRWVDPLSERLRGGTSHGRGVITYTFRLCDVNDAFSPLVFQVLIWNFLVAKCCQKDSNVLDVKILITLLLARLSLK